MTSLIENTPPSRPAEGETATQRVVRLNPDIAKDSARVQAMYAQPAKWELQEAAPAVQVIRDANAQLRTMYDPVKSFGQHVDKRGNRVGVVRDLALALNPESTNAQLDTNVPELAQIAQDVGMTSSDITLLASVVTQRQSEPPTPQQDMAARRQAAAELREICRLDGPGSYDQVLADSMKLARRDPRLHKILEATGAGNDPRVILRFAELGRAARNRGELK
jgi:hypothetical protein